MASSALASSSSAGYNALKSIVTDSQTVIRRKAAFLVGTLIMQSGEKYEGDIPKPVVELIQERMNSGEVSTPLVEGLQAEGVIGQLLAGLRESTNSGEGDVEYEENAMRALVRAVEKGVTSAEDKSALKSIWDSWGAEERSQRGLEGQDAQDIEQSLA
jgi:hsp70-interacting protein